MTDGSELPLIGVPLDAALAACQANKTWQTFVKENSGHDVMIDQPEWLAELILKVS